ncbi:response regulator [Petrachloros mirabilis]
MGDSSSLPRPTYDPQTLLNAQPVMVAVIDPASYIVQFQNETGLKQLGDISGRTCHEAIAGCPAPCSFCKMPQAVENGTVVMNEVKLPSNQHLLVQWSKARTDDGRLHVIETITDVTAQKKVEEAARKAEKMEALERLAGGMAHDMNNLLTVIAGASEKVAHEIEESSSTQVRIKQIQTAVNRAADITRRLVAFSHHQVMQPTLLDITAMLREMGPGISAMLGDGRPLELVLNAGSLPIIADRQQIEHIVTVLVSNAREAMPDGGHLIITTAVDDVAEDMAKEHGVKAGRYIRLEIRDTGNGIPQDVRPHLFEPFFVRKDGQTGRGLGLASVYGIVRQHGGLVEIDSEPDVGTVFAVVLPRAEQVQPAPPGISHARVPDDRPDILLVEDDEDVRLAVSDMLKAAGYLVQEASDGMDALERLREETRPPSLILTDVMMPRMTGPQLAKQIHETMPNMRVLFMSGYSDQMLEPSGQRPLAFIAKPFGANELIKAIRQILA